MNDYFNKYIANQKRRVKNDEQYEENEQNEIYKEKYIKEITWNYNGLTFLKMDDPPPPRNEKPIHLCLYRINTKYKPFLEFGFEYYNENMNFCSIVLGKNEDLSEKCKQFLDTNFEYENNENKDNIEKKENKIYKGYVLYKGSTYIFIDTSLYKSRKNSEKKGIEYLLVYEIIDNRKFFSVNDFFFKNCHFLYLLNEKGEKIETPFIAYISEEEYKLNFLYVMGPLKNNYKPFPFYCFTDKNGSMVSNEKRGAIKFALFLGNMKITNNYENVYDKFDEIFENNFDSLYISKNNNYLPNFPLWIVKNKEQFIPLSIVYQD